MIVPEITPVTPSMPRPGGKPVADQAGRSPSGSVAATLRATTAASAFAWSPGEVSCGGRLAASLTVAVTGTTCRSPATDTVLTICPSASGSSTRTWKVTVSVCPGASVAPETSAGGAPAGPSAGTARRTLSRK